MRISQVLLMLDAYNYGHIKDLLKKEHGVPPYRVWVEGGEACPLFFSVQTEVVVVEGVCNHTTAPPWICPCLWCICSWIFGQNTQRCCILMVLYGIGPNPAISIYSILYGFTYKPVDTLGLDSAKGYSL